MLRARRLPDVAPPPVVVDPDIVEAYRSDASGAPPGDPTGVARPEDEAEAAALLRATRARGLRLLPQAARSSLTGGAIPHGELVVSVERLREAGPIERAGARARRTVGAGLRLDELQERLDAHGLYYPPVPTYRQAMIGGSVATNAGGAATFKYGVTREWVHGLRVLLFNGDLLELERGQATARPGESFRVGLADGTELRVPAPGYRLPPLKKISAGYHAADPLDLVDLFVGSEGTLGLITAVTLELVPAPPAVLTGLVGLPGGEAALALAAALRAAAVRARAHGDRREPDVRAIEWIDARGVDLLRRHGEGGRRRVRLDDSVGSLLLFEMELDRPETDARIEALLADALTAPRGDADHPLARLLLLVEPHAPLDRVELALPGSPARHRALSELREAVPQRVAEILAERARADPGVCKIGGDLIVPDSELAAMVEVYERGFVGRGLDWALWGHLGDGNLHPNALPRSAEQARLGAAALLEFADEAVRRGGSPLSEHGVGRSPIKQEMLRRFLGPGAVLEMRRIKAALDPDGRFAPGVLFPA